MECKLECKLVCLFWLETLWFATHRSTDHTDLSDLCTILRGSQTCFGEWGKIEGVGREMVCAYKTCKDNINIRRHQCLLEFEKIIIKKKRGKYNDE